MNIITIKCPDCGKEVRVNIKTIGCLRAQLRAAEKERDNYKAKLEALAFMSAKKAPPDLAKFFGFK